MTIGRCGAQLSKECAIEPTNRSALRQSSSFLYCITSFDAWIAAAGIGSDKKGALFRSFKKGDKLTDNAVTRSDVLYMIERRAKAAGLPYSTCCHTFRATGITAYMQNGGTLEHAQQIAAHQSPRTTKLYDRTNDEISLEEVERIKF
jgi:integrase/recombinase XerD